MAGTKRALTKSQLSVLSGLFQNLSATGFAIIVISPGFGAIQNLSDLVRLLTINLSWGILFLVMAMKCEEKSR